MFAQLNKSYIEKRPFKALGRLASFIFFEGRALLQPGRWINPIVFLIFYIAKFLPRLRQSNLPIFIIGTGRSGTTILGSTLSFHKDCSFLNEPMAIWHFVSPLDDLIGSYSKSEEAKYRMDASDANMEIRANLEDIYGLYLAITNGRRVVDKYPEHVFRVPFVNTLFPEAKFLFLIRNGWDTCSSIANWSNNKRNEKKGRVEDWWGVNDRRWKLLIEQIIPNNPIFKGIEDKVSSLNTQEDRAAVEWITAMHEGIEMSERYPDSILPIKYESLCGHPDVTLRSILKFCELDDDDVFLDYASTTLNATPPRPPIPLDSCIMPLFEDTMERLGYK